jgi:murein DD-endopeptidase MepM/ murein hydrolase activator NlpD
VTGSRNSIHRGLDLKGDVGAPVYAMADGEVVLAHTMFYEGKMVVVDHGNQIFSYYQHLDSISVKTGDIVKAGDTVGGVGATGMVTGPHLHVAFVIHGVHIDPLSILSLPISK